MTQRKQSEKFWLDETDPAELERRARDMEAVLQLGLAAQLRERARELRDQQRTDQ